MMMRQIPFKIGFRHRHGVSLVETLVVVVVLIVGILAITRVFPEGFASLSYSANKTHAESLAAYQEEYLRKYRENLPEAIVAVDPNTGFIRVNTSPGDFHSGFPYSDNALPGVSQIPEDPRASDVNVARRVLGEAVKIPPPIPAGGPLGESVSLYRPLFAPIYSDQAHPGMSLGVAAYSGTPAPRVFFQDPPTSESAGDLAGFGQHGYGINYDQGLLYFNAMPYDRRFNIEYTFRTSAAGPSMGIPDNCIFVAAGSNYPLNSSLTTYNLRAGMPQPAGCTFVPLGGAILDPGSDILYRRFSPIPVAQAFSGSGGDPYEYKIYDPLLGLMGFNPNAATLMLPQQEARGLTARVDYDVDDWHILRHDVEVPSEVVNFTSPGRKYHAIKLANSNVRRAGDVGESLEFVPGAGVNATFEYQTLARHYPASSRVAPGSPVRTGTPLGVDLVIVDMATGFQIDSTTLQKEGNSSNGYIDYRPGVIHLAETVTLSPPYGLALPAVANVPVAGRHMRVFYRGKDDTAVAAFKPYSHYFLQPALPQLQHHQFYAGYGAGYLLFPGTDAEKTVAVDYTWQEETPPGSGNRITRMELGELHKLQPPAAAFAPVAGCAGAGTFDPAGYWWLRLSRASPDSCQGAGDTEAELTVVPGSLQVRAVRGASIQSRVLWRQNTRWRTLERTTILTREISR